MLRLSNGLIALVFLLIFSAAPASGADKTRIKRELERQYGALTAALARKDVKAYMSMLTPDVVWVWEDGQVLSRNQIEAGLKADVAPTKKLVSNTFKIHRLELSRGTVITLIAGSTTRQVLNRFGTRETLRSSSTRRVTWVKDSRGWKVKRIEVLSSQGRALNSRAKKG